MRVFPLSIALTILAACGGGLTSPTADKAPFDFSFTDPAGDTTTVDPTSGLPKAVDLVAVRGSVQEEKIVLTLEFAEAVVPWSSQATNSLDGFVDLDLDELSATGIPSSAPQADMGVEFYLDLRDTKKGQVALVDALGRAFVLVPVTFSGTTVTIEIPRDELENDDGEFLLSAVVGVPGRAVTDVGPDVLHFVVHNPATP